MSVSPAETIDVESARPTLWGEQFNVSHTHQANKNILKSLSNFFNTMLNALIICTYLQQSVYVEPAAKNSFAPTRPNRLKTTTKPIQRSEFYCKAILQVFHAGKGCLRLPLFAFQHTHYSGFTTM